MAAPMIVWSKMYPPGGMFDQTEREFCVTNHLTALKNVANDLGLVLDEESIRYDFEWDISENHELFHAWGLGYPPKE